MRARRRHEEGIVFGSEIRIVPEFTLSSRRARQNHHAGASMTMFLEIAVAALYAATMFFYFRTQKSVRNSALLSDLLILILLDDNLRVRQRSAMMEFVSSSKYPDAAALSARMTTGFCKIAAAPGILMSASECLEELHRGSRA
jgi:hypothetical protein